MVWQSSNKDLPSCLPLIRFLGHSFAKIPYNTHICRHGCTHTHIRTYTHAHLIRVAYILMPHGQMIIEARLGSFRAATESESHVWGGATGFLYVYVCVCVYHQRTVRGGIDLGRRRNLETWLKSRDNQSQMVR